MRLVRVITIASLTIGSAFGSVLTTDNTFVTSDWSFPLPVQVLGFGSPVFSSGTNPTGGNPGTGPFRELGLIRPVDLAVDATVANIKLNYVYNPGTQGALTGLGYSADFQQLGSFAMNGTWGFALLQNNTVYLNNTTFNSAPSWGAVSIGNQNASNFQNPNTFANPDFSSTGAPIAFGFFLRGVSTGTFNANFNIGMDNLCVWDQNSGSACSAQSNVPEPGTLAMVGCLLSIVMVFRRFVRA